MAYTHIEELVNKTGSVYKLVILASRRALELNSGDAKLVEISPHVKIGTVALEEIRRDKIGFKTREKKS